MSLFGDNWDLVEDYVGTRSRKQIENIAMKEYGSLSFKQEESISLETTNQFENNFHQFKPLTNSNISSR